MLGRHNGAVANDDIAPEVTVINARAWALRPDHVAGRLRQAAPGAVIADPAGAPAGRSPMASLADRELWSNLPDALAEALATSRLKPPPIAVHPPSEGRSSGARSTTAPGRLTFSVEEAAALLDTGRAFAYDAGRRGEIPSIRIDCLVLVPRVALDRLVNGLSAHSEPGGH